MHLYRLGKSGLKVSKVILGAMGYGPKAYNGDWAIEEDKALPLLKYAYDRGINTWDTSDCTYIRPPRSLRSTRA